MKFLRGMVFFLASMVLVQGLAHAQASEYNFDFPGLLKKIYGNWNAQRKVSVSQEKMATGETLPYMTGVFKVDSFTDEAGVPRLFVLLKTVPDNGSDCSKNCPAFLSPYFFELSDSGKWVLTAGERNLGAIVGFAHKVLDISPIRIGKNNYGLALKIQIEGNGLMGHNFVIMAPVSGRAVSVLEYSMISRSDGTLDCLNGICQNLHAGLVVDPEMRNASFSDVWVVENGVEVVPGSDGRKSLSRVVNRPVRFSFDERSLRYSAAR